MRSGKATSIPREIAAFYEKPGGRSLLIKGGAGTGKTTFALQLLEELADPGRSYYLSTRVSDDSLYVQFPWLKDKEMRSRIIDASRAFLQALYRNNKEEEEEAPKKAGGAKVNEAKEFLKTIRKDEGITRVDRTRLTGLMEKYPLPEIERVYDHVEKNLPDRTLFVIDSVEGITSRYRVPEEDLIATLQKDLVEHSNTNLLLVLEKDRESHLDYLVDGVVTMSRGEQEGRRVRAIQMDKLRATEISQPRYLVTLHGGRFHSFEPFSPKVTDAKKWESAPDPAGKYSTGIPALDALLGGGYRQGSYNVIEVGDNVSMEEYYAIIRPILLNFIGHDRGAIMVLMGGEHADALKEDFTRFVDTSVFGNTLHVADYFSATQDPARPYIMAMGTKSREEAIKNWRAVESKLRGTTNRPILDFAGFDTLEYLTGNEIAIRDLFRTVGSKKVSKDLGIGVLKPGLKLTQEIMNMSDTYLKIVDINKSCCIFGVKPHTIIHVITPDAEKGYPHVGLTPVV